MRHFLTLADFTKQELLEMISLAQKIKKQTLERKYVPYMQHKTLGMIFEKSSTRTRVSFETGIYQLGGIGLFLSKNDIQLGRGEPMKDTARVISRMVDMVMIRTFEQSKIEEFAAFSKVPVINGLTDAYHPVQLLTDYLTMIEFGKGVDPVVAYVGDGNNMAASWLMLASKIIISNDPSAAIKGADVVTTDTWISMGKEDEKSKRVADFKGYMVDSDMMQLAKSDAIFLHCLPAYRGYEVSDEVLEAHADAVFSEAENRLHMQKGIMVWLDARR
ncbi:MAG: ornithine carbamoyltransferase [Sulfurovaceae bacterium]